MGFVPANNGKTQETMYEKNNIYFFIRAFEYMVGHNPKYV